MSWQAMTKYIVDSYAWIEYLAGTKSGLVAKKIIEIKDNVILTTSIVLAEVVSKVKREGLDAERAYQIISSLSKVLAIGTTNAKNAGILHAEIRRKIKNFGLADAFTLAVAQEQKARVLTGDAHFRNFKEAVMIK
jgi:predicted nucleic acid-binding protein